MKIHISPLYPKRQYQLIRIFIFLICYTSYGNHVKGYTFLGFEWNQDSVITFDMMKYIRRSDNKIGYYLESVNFPVCITSDPLNNGRTNLSLSTLFQPLIGWYGRTLFENDINWPAVFASIFNGRQGLNLKLFDEESRNFILITISNSTDYFVFQKLKWLRVSPGINCGVLLNDRFSFQIGLNRTFRINSNDIYANNFLKISFFITSGD